MPEPEEKRIPIKSFTGNEEGQNLVNCYFKQKPDGTYNFHDKDDKVKAREITVGRAFRFELDEKPGVFWTLTLVRKLERQGRPQSGGWNLPG